MKPTDPLHPRCPVRTTLELLGGKWRLLIIAQLREETLRFGALRRRIPDISEKMLTQELKVLADSGLVARHNYGEVPPRVEYALTAAGQAALPLLDQIQQFGLAYDRQRRGADHSS